jgi:hypothetical protein
MARQVQRMVDLAACMESCRAADVTKIVQLGPGNALPRIMHDLMLESDAHSLPEFKSLSGFELWVQKLVIRDPVHAGPRNCWFANGCDRPKGRYVRGTLKLRTPTPSPKSARPTPWYLARAGVLRRETRTQSRSDARAASCGSLRPASRYASAAPAGPAPTITTCERPSPTAIRPPTATHKRELPSGWGLSTGPCG